MESRAAPAPLRSYRARRGRIGPVRRDTLARLAPTLSVVVDGAPLQLPALFGRAAPVVLDIGSGMGEATAALAAAEPARDVLAVEVYTAGVAHLLGLVEAAGLTNVRVAEGDAVTVLREMLAPGSLAGVRALFPDPWHKTRHAKRRLVSAGFADLVADRLESGGTLHVATDWPPYAEQVVSVLTAHPAFTVVSRGRVARPVTRFEQQGLDAGRPPHDVVAVRC